MRILLLVMSLISLPSWAHSDAKVISAGASITEIVYALQAQDQLIATDVTSKKWHRGKLADVGYHRQLTAEGILALSPNLLLVSKEAGPQHTLDMLQQAGVEVAVVQSGNTLADLKTRIKQIAEKTQHQDEATALLKQVDELAAQLTANQPAKDKRQKAIFVLMREGRAPSLAGADTPADTIITLMGADNPAAAKISSYKPASTEALVAMAPDVIIMSKRTLKQLGSIDALLEQQPALAATPAGQKRRILAIDGTSLIGEIGINSLKEALRLNQEVYAD
ncbi:heme/hemin ABC transporter substrate-binding protein [Motilimonas pumila]|uniref:Hemin ABC transporter substrate-binding protein n=1 Tax=Motilimonas pumila TaxID=2303987 RepID=A0A418YEC1_9GAMM|nr:ABC transporter substrate-binding protein [Motilimonas pumila]RJG47493.1 hemin ABC transporter substrate-binding protein [Motilimonas pumila]